MFSIEIQYVTPQATEIAHAQNLTFDQRELSKESY